MQRSVLSVGVVAVLAAWLGGCDASPDQAPPTAAVAPSGLETTPVVISGEKFDIELAYKPEDIILGLGGRHEIDPRGGMLFIFPQPGFHDFVMRDCFADIDIAFLDAGGKVLSLHAMTVEEPRREGETENAYNRRLKRYPSRYRASFALETAGGTWARMGVHVGDQIAFDTARLKSLAR